MLNNIPELKYATVVNLRLGPDARFTVNVPCFISNCNSKESGTIAPDNCPVRTLLRGLLSRMSDDLRNGQVEKTLMGASCTKR